ncbi:uncharacterized protein LY89DRAFT_242945 [Mollisia scopiformis]|uniref:Uncharacterized protein n=1 Tax=Mollisia scopiformis TaxID=149040 RepID=A0A194WUL0_MOLSC|nr:uncharacterized protein LY89DRAFT_242945 [Mollisia scopiformis]KUJ11354.1 hypothetical protein LY89DRAFT_242945 [Mollisia scopiformis]
MHIPSVIAAVLGIRQVGNLLPSSYCSPYCPNCKGDVAVFDGSITSCTPNSSFIANCGACQTCVLDYNLQNGETSVSKQVETALINILNLCANTTVSTEIAAMQSQASRINEWGEQIATTTSGGTLSSVTTTSKPTTTNWEAAHSDNPSWTTMLSTASWAPYYSARKSAESVSAASAVASSLALVSAALANETARHTSSPTPSLTSTADASAPPLSQSWVAGPVMGSILGMSTVFVVIFFTRRKQRRDMLAQDPVPKPFHDVPTSPSTRSSSAAGEDVPQLHGESVEIKELESTEVHELPALEPVGTELNTPMEARPRIRLAGDGIGEDFAEGEDEQWAMQSPLPLSPLPLLFAMSELRDQRMGRSESLRHETYYHP